MADIVRLNDVRYSIRAEVLKRYEAMKQKGAPEDVARNTAAAQASGASFGRHTPSLFRRELDALLEARARPRFGVSPEPPPTPPAAPVRNRWSLPT